MDVDMKARALEIVRDIQTDLAADVERHEVEVITGLTLGTIHGELAGSIAGLAGVVEKMLEA